MVHSRYMARYITNATLAEKNAQVPTCTTKHDYIASALEIFQVLKDLSQLSTKYTYSAGPYADLWLGGGAKILKSWTKI